MYICILISAETNRVLFEYSLKSTYLNIKKLYSLLISALILTSKYTSRAYK